MINYSSKKYFHLGFTVCLILSGLINGLEKKVFAQITPDGTLPNNSSVSREGNKFNINDGTKAGTNLFHSFKEFSVPTGNQAHFQNAVDISNIITRVTGKSISDIDGLIKANGTANLFLINPNGIVFGENAKLEIGGSFVGSTADAIVFSEDNFFSASNPDSSSLLKVNPNALFFNQIKAASIESNSVKDLRVPFGKSLLLVGGDINIDGGRLRAFGGRVELGGLAGKGTVGLNLNEDGNNISLNFTEGVEKSNVTLSESAVNVRTNNNGGSIAVNARNLKMINSRLLAGINLGRGSDDSRAGDIDINVTDEIILNNRSRIDNRLSAKAKGQAGDININAGTLLLRNGAWVSNSISSSGKGGNITVNAQDVKLIGQNSRLSAEAWEESTKEGNAGDLTINTNTLLVQDGAWVSTDTLGKGNGGNLTVNASDVKLISRTSGLFARSDKKSTGDAGDLTINTNTLLAQDGARVSSSTSTSGKGGNLIVNASDVQLIGTSKKGDLSGFFAEASKESTEEGDAGDLTIKTNTLLVQDGAKVSTNTSGEGDGGNLTVNASDVQLIGESKNNNLSGLFAQTREESTGDAGDVTINTNTLLAQDGAQVNSNTSTSGKGGNIIIDAQNVKLIGKSKINNNRLSGLFAEAWKNSRDAGDLTIKTNTLLVQDGARVSNRTYAQGNGGNITIDAQNVRLIGDSSGLFTETLKSSNGLFTEALEDSTGNAGDLTIKTTTLLVQDGAKVNTSTSSGGNGGNITIDAQDVQLIGNSKKYLQASLVARANPNSSRNAGSVTINTNTLRLEDGGNVSISTEGKGKAGDLTVDAVDVELIGENSGFFAQALENSTGDGGNLTINTNSLQVKDGAEIAVEGFTTKGTGGRLTINADSIRLNNKAILGASTRSNKVDPEREQATININSQELIMRRDSIIRTNAQGKNVIGGNINIDTDILAALENSDISANSADSRGGKVRIKTQGRFGTQFRRITTDKSDITATGATQDLSGTVEINEPEIDRSNTEELPTDVVDVTGLVDQNLCEATQDSEFIITGRGGIPTSPTEVLEADAGWEDWRILSQNRSNIQQRVRKTKPKLNNEQANNKKNRPLKIVEAQGWVVDSNGDIIFTAYPPSANRHTSALKDLSCNVGIRK